ncbi:MAG: rod shape-determining protein MreC [Candidatus Niyogibacteria bacterium]|nr:rod shape-determining protein MreC [Candidatus Niyogibacteria bacterium]
MKTSYRRNNIFGSAKWYVLTGAFLALLLLFVAFGDALERPVRASVFWFSAPVFHISTFLKSEVNNVASFFFDKERLAAENEDLREMVDNLKGNIERAEILKKESEDLRTALGRTAGRKIFGRVALAPPAAAYDTFVVDIGRTAGVSPGMNVISIGGVYLGTIAEVYDGESKVALASGYGRETNVYLEGSGTPAMAVGIGGEGMKISLPASLPALEVGERVLSAGGESYLIGFIEKIENKKTDPIETVYLRLPLNVLNLRSVFVI